MTSSRSRISRETRLLLLTIAISLTMLWALARLRFQERPARPDLVPPVLAQLRPTSGFEDLALALADLRPRVAASIVRLASPVLRIQRDEGVTLIAAATAESVLAWDPASGFAVVKIPAADAPRLIAWTPKRLDYPRYLVAADVSTEQISLRPVFVGSLSASRSPLWFGTIWIMPPATALAPGTFVFTTDGDLAGLAVEHDGRAALVPAEILLDTARRLIEQKGALAGTIGIHTQPMSADVAAASGAATGVVVTWIDPVGPAAGLLETADVVEAIDDEKLLTALHWRARVARLHAGEMIALQVRRQRQIRIVHLIAVPTVPRAHEVSLGLRLGSTPGGAEVLAVQPESAAARAGIQSGDAITLIGTQRGPTAPQVSRAFAALVPGASLLVAITRGESHHVVALKKP